MFKIPSAFKTFNLNQQATIAAGGMLKDAGTIIKMRCQPTLEEFWALLFAVGKLADLGIVFQAEDVGLLSAHVHSDGACQGHAPPECWAAPAQADACWAGRCWASQSILMTASTPQAEVGMP